MCCFPDHPEHDRIKEHDELKLSVLINLSFCCDEDFLGKFDAITAVNWILA